jgi:glycerophosphoryl diester phosphodiesterase
MVIAHRGNRRAAPENTLAAFRRAIEDGADIIETDVHITADDDFVLIHDSTLDRTTRASGLVGEKSATELRTIRADRGWEGFEGETIPLLDQLLALLPLGVGLLLELKSDRFLEPWAGVEIARRLQKSTTADRTGFISFSEERLEAVRDSAPSIPSGLVTMKGLWPQAGYELAGPFWPILLLNPLYTAAAHARDVLITPLDPNPDARLWLYSLMRCDAVLTDDPATTRRKLDALPRFLKPGSNS